MDYFTLTTTGGGIGLLLSNFVIGALRCRRRDKLATKVSRDRQQIRLPETGHAGSDILTI